jgi:FkbM family methyltransferase
MDNSKTWNNRKQFAEMGANLDMTRLEMAAMIPKMKLKARGVYDNLFGIGVIPKKKIKPFIPENPVILEAGAHSGKDTVEMAKVWKHGHIHAFEPVPELYARLLNRTKNMNNVTCYQLALGTTTGKQEMFFSSGMSDGSSSLLKPTESLKAYPGMCFGGELVEVTTIDKWAEENQISHIDFMWLDLQGMELKVLMQSKTVLDTVKAIYSEVSESEVYEGQTKYSMLREWLKMNGFHLKIAAELNGEGNVLFVRDTKS